MRKSLVVVLCWVLLVDMTVAGGAVASDRPRIAVIEFENKADNRWWHNGGADAAQDVFVTELVKSGKFRVVERERLDALMEEKHLTLSGDVDPSTAVRIGRLLGVKYLLTGAVTEYGVTENSAHAPGVFVMPSFSFGKRRFVAALNARMIDTSTGEVVWADEASDEETNVKVFVGGFGGGVDDERMFDKVLKPCIQKLASSIKAASL